jgi:hypothetical protein
MGRVKSAIYARLEEMSFRSGAVLAAGLLGALVAAIVLAVTLGGHGTTGSGHSTAEVGAAAAGASGSVSAARPASPQTGGYAAATPTAGLRPADSAGRSFAVVRVRRGFMADWPGSRRGGRPHRDGGGPPGGWPARLRHGPRRAASWPPARW